MPVPSLKLSHHLQPRSASYNQATSSFIGPCDIKITRSQALCQGFFKFLLKLSSQNRSQNVFKPILYMVFVQFLIFQKFYLMASMHPCFWLGNFLFLPSTHSFKRGEVIKPIGKVSVINGTVVFCHFQGRMSQQLLEGKCVSSAVQQILSGKGMSEHVDGSLFNASLVVITSNR